MSAAAGPTMALPAARGLAFLALCGFASLQWMQMVEPAARGRAGYALLAATAVMLGLLLAARLPHRVRTPAAVAVAVAGCALALLGGGVADEQLSPDRWGELAAGIGRGISALPGARVPYRGLDEWTRLVLCIGGTLLAVMAAAVAFWPRERGLGMRNLSLVLLVTLYAIPAVALDLSAEFLSGGLLFVLAITYLRLERLPIDDASAAGALAVGVTLLGLAAAPALDTDSPWFDYETWALSNASSKSTAFSWQHSYDLLDWPRDGRELLRVRAKRAAYWKAMNLDIFDGSRWTADRGATNLDGCDIGGYSDENRERFTQTIEVSVRNLRTQKFVTAGVACWVDAPRIPKIPFGDGTYASATRELRRGDAYKAFVYTPAPSEVERRGAPGFLPHGMERFTRIELRWPGPDSAPSSSADSLGELVQLPAFRDDEGVPVSRPLSNLGADPVPAADMLRRSAYARTYALARRLKRGADTQEDFVQAVMRHLDGDGFSYTENPPRVSANIDGFLFDSKAGYCQHYSGAMALLLRMGGVPARVSAGFTAGAFDRDAGEYVVRDLDAHSWVEVWYSGFGWVTMDPTPAAAPVRRPGEDGGDGSLAIGGAPDLGGDVRTDPSRRFEAGGGGPDWELIAAAALAAIGLAGLGVWLLRRHRRRLAAGWGPLAELERALVRARRAPGPAATLTTLESRFSRTPAAAGYVRALRDQRYGGRGGPPTPAGRRAVRHELGRGGGLGARLRSWWALPPRPRAR